MAEVAAALFIMAKIAKTGGEITVEKAGAMAPLDTRVPMGMEVAVAAGPLLVKAEFAKAVKAEMGVLQYACI